MEVWGTRGGHGCGSWSDREAVLWGPGEKGFVDFRVMPRCAGLEGAKKMPGVN